MAVVQHNAQIERGGAFADRMAVVRQGVLSPSSTWQDFIHLISKHNTFSIWTQVLNIQRPQALHIEAKQILIKIRNAMQKGYSKLLIYVVVLPSTNASTAQATMNVQMMSLLYAGECTEADWRRLLTDAGLQVLTAGLTPGNGNSTCAQWCQHQNLDQTCKPLAAKGQGPCYTCGPARKAATQELCSGACTDTSTDSKNCASCGTVCPAGSTCSQGVCTCTNSGLGLCNETCPSFDSDNNHCGECGNVVRLIPSQRSLRFLGTEADSEVLACRPPQLIVSCIFDMDLPWGVAVGDFNGDGHLDLAVSNAGNETVSILLGTGLGSFQAQIAYAAGSFPFQIAVGDFNGDGILDLVSGTAANTVTLLLGTGEGSFQPPLQFPVGLGPVAIAVADFNQDGHLDVVTGNHDGNSVSVLLGTGEGSFQSQTQYAVGSTPDGVAVGDFNQDGHLDLVVGNEGSNVASVLLGNGDGSFQPQTTVPVGSGPYGVTVADFNKDGRPDFAVTNSMDASVSVLLGVGNGTFQPQAVFAVGSYPRAITTGDFNKDGELDIAVTNDGGASVSILLGMGFGGFLSPAATFAVGNNPTGIAVGDFNGDGYLDLVTTNIVDTTISVLLGRACNT
ncbi:integrin alpha N-terminal domain-containing protein [Aspergillus uvarum CBS 121591]|uniref:Integrin alpha N-terminal domain-containing protein n=1 Tax=Aspergillus uvarum CBS 121591 TaxID=1448315 RepID=A0A319CJ81_9EURO|nr:integrin alpha N-terminal domain-containing protein [Aspergillus uvarum CBS 121591]PYH75478.1 integrin alpha N-terminal domain-containing protein [Aspergillus uvarum CBS 121591]